MTRENGKLIFFAEYDFHLPDKFHRFFNVKRLRDLRKKLRIGKYRSRNKNGRPARSFLFSFSAPVNSNKNRELYFLFLFGLTRDLSSYWKYHLGRYQVSAQSVSVLAGRQYVRKYALVKLSKSRLSSRLSSSAN